MGGFEIFITITFSVFVLFVYFSFVDRKRKRQSLNGLRSNGFNVSYLMNGVYANVAVDVHDRSAAFIYAKRVIKVPFDKIMSWQHTYVEKSSVVNGNHKHSIINNAIEFTIKDPAEPLLKIVVSDYDYAREWVARFSAILND